VAPSGNRRQRKLANDERARATDEVVRLDARQNPLEGGTLDLAVG
jgi:hypothetical protein